MRLSRRSGAAVAAAALMVAVGLVVALRGDEEPASSAPAETTAAEVTETEETPLPPYALQPTSACLRQAGFAVSGITSQDPRLRALGDLAQRTSLEVHRDGETLGLAFGDAQLLASLLQVPNDSYRIEIRRNALLMYRPDARTEAAVLRGCLRP